MKCAKYLGLAATFFLLIPAAAFAKDKPEHNVRLYEPVLVGSSTLQPGHYKVEWQGTGQAVPIKFLRDGKIVLSTTGQVVDKSKPPQTDEITTEKTNNKERLQEIDFGHRKEALLFTSHTAGM